MLYKTLFFNNEAGGKLGRAFRLIDGGWGGRPLGINLGALKNEMIRNICLGVKNEAQLSGLVLIGSGNHPQLARGFDNDCRLPQDRAFHFAISASVALIFIHHRQGDRMPDIELR